MENSDEVEKVIKAIADAGFEPEPQKTTKPEIEEEPAETEAEETWLTVELPLDKVSVGTLTNILEAKGTLIKKALGIKSVDIGKQAETQ